MAHDGRYVHMYRQQAEASVLPISGPATRT